jgi:Mrp family chromosome partitioning ATPase
MSAYFESLNRGTRSAYVGGFVPAVIGSSVAPAPAVRPPVRSAGPRARPVAAPYGVLRERLLVAANGHALRAIVFAGCEGGEGSTEIAREFGETLAASGLRVLLLDVGGGRVATASPIDLMQLVARDWVALAAVHGKGQLTVVASQASNPDKEHFYRSAELASWLKKQRDLYNYILVTAPPIGRFADGTLLGRLCDGVVIVVEAGATRREALTGAREQLERSGVKVIGAVLNRARDELPALLRPYFPTA